MDNKTKTSLRTGKEQLDLLLQQISQSIYGVSDTEPATSRLDTEFQDILRRNRDGLDVANDDTITSFVSMQLRNRNRSGFGIDSTKSDVFSNLFRNGINDSQVTSMISNAYKYRMVKQADIEELVKILPELSAALSACVDVIVSGADIVDGDIVRKIEFDGKSDEDSNRYKLAVEAMEKKFDLKNKIKRYIVPKTLEFGSYFMLVIPYSKIFSDFLKSKMDTNEMENINKKVTMPFSESVTLKSVLETQHNYDAFYSESESIFFHEIEESINSVPNKGSKIQRDQTKELEKLQSEFKEEMKELTSRIVINKSESPLTVLEESEEAVEYILNKKYPGVDTYITEMLSNPSTRVRNRYGSIASYKWVTEENTIPIKTPNTLDVNLDNYNKWRAGSRKPTLVDGKDGELDTDKDLFENDVKDAYIKLVPPTRLCRIDLMGEIIGYLYVKSEETDLLGGVVGSRMGNIKFGKEQKTSLLLDTLASEIVNAFDKKFVKNNLKFKKLIVEALNYYDLNSQRVIFQFIPAEYVVEFNVNVDENGFGTSMMDKALFPAKLYAVMVITSIFMYIANSSDTRNIFIRSSGIDKNTRSKVEEVARRFQQRRINVTDLWNYTGLLNKLSYGNDVYYPTGTSGEQPLTTEIVQGQDVNMQTDVMEMLRKSYILATGVPSAIINYLNELEFSRQGEMANAKFIALVISLQIDLSRDITEAYKAIMRYSTEIPEDWIDCFKFSFPKPKMQNEQTIQQKMDTCKQQLEFYISYLFGTNYEQNPSLVGKVREFSIAFIIQKFPELDMENIVQISKDIEIKFVDNTLKPNPDKGTEDMDVLDSALGGGF